MKTICIALVTLITFNGFSQSLPITFESDVTTSDFVDFDGGTATVTANPSLSGINTSNSVAQIIRDGGAIFAGSKILLTDNLDFSVLTKISMKVFTTAPVGTVVKFKLEGSGPSAEVDAFTTVSGEWETLEWIFVGTPNNLNEIVFMFDFGTVGDGTPNSTFYFDDIEQVAGPTAPVPTSLPIDFESGVVDTDFLNFNGATAAVVANPQVDANNTSTTVGRVIKDGGEYWAASKILLDNPIDLTSQWHMSMKVYTEAPIGTRIKLELESADGRTNLDYLTTVSGEWETASWNFDGQANNYDRIQLLFDFGNVGDGTASSTFFFDDIQQVVGPEIPEPIATEFPIDFENGVVTSDFLNFNGAFTTVIPNPQIDADNPSATVGKFVRSGGAPWAQSRIALTEFMDYSTLGTLSMKVYTDAPVGTLLKFKVESNVANFADERDAVTTVSGAWETYTWEFPGDIPPLYNVITLMLGYATPNDASASATFLFDDIQQTENVLSVDDNQTLNADEISSFPNPVKDQVTITSKNKTIKSIAFFDVLGQQVSEFYSNQRQVQIDLSGFKSGIYIAKVTTDSGASGNLKIIVK